LIKSLSVEPLPYALGAIVHDADLTNPEEHLTEIKQALNRYSVLVFRNQILSPEQHITFSQNFGKLETHVLTADLHGGHPEIFVLSNKKNPDGTPMGRYRSGWYWHTDLSYTKVPSAASHMYAKEVPSYGGDTMFASMYAAYNALSGPMRVMLYKLAAEHSLRYGYDRFVRPLGGKPIPEETFDRYRSVIHPVVFQHPRTKRSVLYVNEGFTSRIVTLPKEEGKTILDFLTKHATQPKFVYQHRWQVNDFVMWDNLATQHCAMGNYTEDRLMHRTTVAGDGPVQGDDHA